VRLCWLRLVTTVPEWDALDDQMHGTVELGVHKSHGT